MQGCVRRPPQRQATTVVPQPPRILAFCAANSSSVRMPCVLRSARSLSCWMGSGAGAACAQDCVGQPPIPEQLQDLAGVGIDAEGSDWFDPQEAVPGQWLHGLLAAHGRAAQDLLDRIVLQAQHQPLGLVEPGGRQGPSHVRAVPAPLVPRLTVADQERDHVDCRSPVGPVGCPPWRCHGLMDGFDDAVDVTPCNLVTGPRASPARGESVRAVLVSLCSSSARVELSAYRIHPLRMMPPPGLGGTVAPRTLARRSIRC